MATNDAGFAVVVVNYASSGLLEEALAPMAGWRRPPSVVVVDNFSGAAEQDRVRTLADAHGWTPVLQQDNRGFGAGVNAGAATAIAAGAEVLLILNPDAAIGEESAELLAAACGRDPWALYSPKVLKADGSAWFDGAVLDLDAGRTMSARRAAALGLTRTMPWITGAALTTSASLWTALGGFDEDYFLYWEDVDLSARALRLGAGLHVVQQATARHEEGGTQALAGTDRAVPWTRSEAYYYYNIRNRLLFAARNLPPDEARGWSREALRSAYATLLIGGRRKFLRPVMPLRAAYRGVRDGRAFLAASDAAAPSGLATAGRRR